MTRAATANAPSPSRRRAAKSPASGSASPVLAIPLDYFQQSQRPLYSLLFLLPLIIIYEFGSHWYTVDPLRHTEVRIIAFNLLQDFFRWFGATGRYLPAGAVVVILMTWHIARCDSWKVRGGPLIGMAAESAILALPIILISALSAHHLPLGGTIRGDWRSLVVLALGAGIYEELVFRLIGFTVLHLVLVDVMRCAKPAAALLIVLIPSMLFSLYHYLGADVFTWQSFVFRSLAGIYFGILFLYRGFGITAGAHAAYDILIVALAARV